MLYPTYSANPTTVKDEVTFTTANSISSSPLVRVKFANLISKGEVTTASSKRAEIRKQINGEQGI